MLAFDKDGYFVSKTDQDTGEVFDPYKKSMKVLHKSDFLNGFKFLAVKDEESEEIRVIKEEANLTEYPEVFEGPFLLEDIEHGLKQLDNSGLERLLNLKDALQQSDVKKVA